MRRIIAMGSIIIALRLSPDNASFAQGAFNMGMLTNTNAMTASARARSVSGAITPALRRPPAPSSANVALPYDLSPASRQHSFEAFLARLRSRSPRDADTVAQAFSGQDYARIYQGIAGPFGLRANDTADALTAYVVLGWMIANGASDPAPRSIHAVRAQIAAALAHDGRLGAPGARAALGEEYKILFVVLHSGWQAARREGAAARYADGVADLFGTESRLALRRYTLGPAGFAPASGR